MKSHLRKSDPVKERFNSLSMQDVIANNLSLQSTRRALEQDFQIRVSPFGSDYFFSEIFKTKFTNYSEDDKTKICKLLANLRSKELLTTLEYGN